MEKHRKDRKGVKIEFSYDNVRENHKGGLLNEILEFVEKNILYANKLWPIIKKKGAPLIKEHIVPMITE